MLMPLISRFAVPRLALSLRQPIGGLRWHVVESDLGSWLGSHNRH